VSESDRFEELSARAVQVTLDGRTFFVASIDDLIAMKRRAGRPQDLLDIEQLQDIQRRIR
jgi:predicted nucleotidyltransferase